MNKKHLILGICLSVVAVVMLFTCIFFMTKPFTPEGEGTITVQYVDVDGTVIKEKEIIFNEGDKLTDLIDANFDNFVMENGMIMGIEDFITDTTTWNPYIGIYVDGEMSQVGILEVEYEDGTVITLRLTSYTMA